MERFKAVISGFQHLLENFSLDDFIRTMDSAGVDKAVIVPIDLTSAYGVHLGTNEDMARFVDKYSDRLIGFGSVDPERGDALERLEHGVKKLGLKGLKLVPPLQKFDPSNEKFNSFWEKCLELGIPVWTHAGHQVSMPRSIAKYGHPLLWDEVAQRYPELTIIMGHCATPWFWDAWSVVLRNENIYLDISYYRHLYEYIPWKAYSHHNLEHKLLFATDFPLTSFQEGIQAVKNLTISEEFKAKILGDNAERLLNIE